MINAFENGVIISKEPLSLPISTPRLQAVISNRGVLNIAVWGQGPVGSVFFKIKENNSTNGNRIFRAEPNIFCMKDSSGKLEIYALRDYPAIIISNMGFSEKIPVIVKPYKGRITGLDGDLRKIKTNKGITFQLPNGALVVFVKNGKVKLEEKSLDVKLQIAENGYLIVSAGDFDEANKTAERLNQNIEEFINRARSYSKWIGSRLLTNDKIIGSLFAHCLHAAISSYKENSKNGFAGLSAGPGYSIPARSYYRDSYWTIQTLLPFQPDWVRKEILLLANGIRENGEAPSAVIIPGKIGDRYWRTRISSEPELKYHHRRPEEWWSDHFDSPLFFILMVFDYCYWTNNFDVLNEYVKTKTIWDIILTIVKRYDSLPSFESLPLKPFNDRDWADNVFRSGIVTYDSGLYYRALTVVSEEASRRKLDIARKLIDRQKRVRKSLLANLWVKKGFFKEYRDTESSIEEIHLNLDTLIAVRAGVLDVKSTERVLDNINGILVTKNNRFQKYGDWGIMCTYPPYKHKDRLRGKTIFPYRYHNGSDWPYLDAIFADLLLYHKKSNWRYALTRWWEYSLSKGWIEPVEYYSPPWGRGALLQAWSSLPAAAIIQGGFGLHPERRRHSPPWGNSALQGVKMYGREIGLNWIDN